MKIHTNPVWLSTEVQACIEPPSIPLIEAVTEDVNECGILKIKIRRNTAAADS